MNALALIAQGIVPKHHVEICSATTAIQAQTLLRDSYNRTTKHNQVMITFRLHNSTMDEGLTVTESLENLDEFIVGLLSLVQPVEEKWSS
uniref:Uncharacterized protein n=1 Tax=Peronospora matthiolae TaxID=2874970 RepID=A0AAV1UFQ1_9STRA